MKKLIVLILCLCSLASFADPIPVTLEQKQAFYKKEVRKQTRKPKDKDLRQLKVIVFVGISVVIFVKGHWIENP